MNSSGKDILDKILRSILSDKDTVAISRRISAVELLRKLKSDDIDQTSKLILFSLLISEVLDKMKLSDFAALFDKAFSQPLGASGKVDFDLREQGKTFLKENRIAEKDIRIVEKIISGVPLREFRNQLEISSSTGNKRIRRLCERLGLRNREQLIFVFGYLHLISLDLNCLRTEEKVTNLSKG
jgi:DNA-binding CsgD family transcriptional regulator